MAFVLFLLILRLNLLARRMRTERRDLWVASRQSFVLVVLQILSGALLIITKLSLMAFLLHVTIATFLVSSLSLLGFRTFLSKKEWALAYNHE